MLLCIRSPWIKIVVYFSINLKINELLAQSSSEVELLIERPKRKIHQDAGFDLNEEDMARFHIWPSGIIPYYIDDFSYDKVLRDRIRIFLNSVNYLTGLRFMEVPTPPEDDKSRWVLFLNRKGLLGCADHPFKNFTSVGVQRVVLGYHCINTDEDLADVVLSLVGVPPQHNCPDRDKHITVMKENIIPDKLHLFGKVTDNEWIFHDLDYDFLSAGHYGRYKHNLNGNVVFVIKNSLRTASHFNHGKAKEKGFSSNDILKIKMLYNYISRNRDTLLKGPECSKLFEPSSKFSSSIPAHPKVDIKPRQKPSRYKNKSNIGKDSDEEKNVNDYNERSDDEIDKENTDGENNRGENNDKNDEKCNISKGNNIDENYSKDSKKGNEKKSCNSNNGKDQEVNSESDENVENVDNIKPLEGYQNSKMEANNISYKSSKITDNIMALKLKLHTLDAKSLVNRGTLTQPVNSKMKKILSQSDYETGDEGEQKYVHEKNF